MTVELLRLSTVLRKNFRVPKLSTSGERLWHLTFRSMCGKMSASQYSALLRKDCGNDLTFRTVHLGAEKFPRPNTHAALLRKDCGNDLTFRTVHLGAEKFPRPNTQHCCGKTAEMI